MLLPALALSLLACVVALYMVAPPVYLAVLQATIFDPAPTPFIDLEYLLTNATCWQQGIDVYAVNPCDPLGRPMAYSPLWLRMGFLAIDRAWSQPLGLGLAIAYCLSLGLLPPTRRWRDSVYIGLAGVSSQAVFGLERGNADIAIYLGALAAGMTAHRGVAARMGGYAALLFVGLLKFYPLAALLTVLRERLAIAIGLSVAAGLALLSFVLRYGAELAEMARNIPAGLSYLDVVGATQLPLGLWVCIRRLLPDAVAAWAPAPLVAVGLTMGFVAAASAICVTAILSYRTTIAGLPARDKAMLTIGAAMIIGCFATGASFGYRAVLLLLVLPALSWLDRPGMPPALRGICRATILAILFAMYRLTVLSILRSLDLWPSTSVAGSLAWIVFQLVWWWIVAVLVGLLACLLIGSPALREIGALFGRTAPLTNPRDS